MEKTGEKIAYLDGIRGVAALGVFLHHFLLIFYCAYFSFDPTATNSNCLDIAYGKSIWSVLSNGNYFVCIFFVLSGFVLSRSYFQSGNIQTVVSATLRRFLRLYIPVAFTLCLAWAMLKAGAYCNGKVATLAHSGWWFGSMWQIEHPTQALIKCLGFSTMFKGDSILDTSMWTLSTELYGSMFVFAFLALTHQSRNKWLSLLLVTAVCAGCQQYYMFCFSLGMGMNFAEHRKPLKYSRYIDAFSAVSFIILSMLLGSYPSNDMIAGTFYEHIGHTVMEYSAFFHSVGAGLLVLAFVLSGRLQQLFSSRVFRFLGYISFSIYLLHPLVFGVFSSWFFLKLNGSLPYFYNVVINFFATLLVAFPVSWLMARYIDAPGIRLSKYVYERWFKNVQ